MRVGRRAIWIAFAIAGVLAPPTPVLATAPSPTSERLLVGFVPGSGADARAALDRHVGALVIGEITQLDVQIVNVPSAAAATALAAYRDDPIVRYAEPDARGDEAEVPNDTYYPSQWGLAKVRAAAAWDITHASSAVRIAILDTGIHAVGDLSGKIVTTKNLSNSWTSDDIRGHGTHVAGIAAAATDNARGVAGLGWASSLMNVKVLGDDGIGWYSDMAQGMTWAADHGASVINMSFGGTTPSTTLRDAIDYAWGKGVVLAAAAGNNGSSAAFYPAYYANAIAVAATTSGDNLASFSDYGSWVDTAAPGTSILSTTLGGYESWSGTSMATPFVAGLAALVFSVARDTNGNGRLNDEVRTRILATDDSVGLPIGGGRINAYRAVQGGAVAGTVSDSLTGLPVSGATVTIGSRTTTTSSRGAYTVANLWPASYTMAVSSSAYVTTQRSVSVALGATTLADFALTPYVGSIAGTVTAVATGLPIAGAAVGAGGRTATTDAVGQYRIDGLSPGTYTVSASAAGYVTASKAVTVSSGTTAAVDFGLVVFVGSVAGVATDWSTGLPLAGVTVDLGDVAATTDTDGAYRLDGLDPGTYATSADLPGYVPASRSITVMSGQTTSADFVLVPEAITGTITGTVIDGQTGLPATGLSVDNGSATTVTAADGTYTLPWVIEGAYVVTASGAPYLPSSGSIQVVAGATTVVDLTVVKPSMWVTSITLASSGSRLRVDVSVVDELGHPATGVAVAMDVVWNATTTRTFTGATGAGGTVSFTWLKAPKGPYTATVTELANPSYVWDPTKGVTSAAFRL